MDEAGIDMQVLSHGAPSAQKLPAETAAALTRRVNDRLHAAIARPSEALRRLRGAADRGPAAAADELERTTKLGFKGAMLHGIANGEFLDDKRFWPIYARAEKLDVPIYLHPSRRNPTCSALLRRLHQGIPDGGAAGLGLHGRDRDARDPPGALRRVRAHPKLKIILGHLGETLPFLVWRIDHALARPGQKPMSFRDMFCSNFYITTSGNFSNPALLCCVMEMGIDHILFAVDWPFVVNPPATQWMDTVPLCDEDKAKILSGNAKQLLRM